MREHNRNLTGSPEVTIIGGGIIGCALAYRLSRDGVSTRLLERRDLAREASWASAGIISPPAPRYGSRTELALRSYSLYPDLIREIEQATGVSTGYVATGEIEVAGDENRRLLEDTLAWQRANGMQVELLDRQALHDAEPALHARFSLGLFARAAGSVVLGRLAAALARAAQQRGASVHEHLPVTRIVVDGSRATAVETFEGRHTTGAVVIAAGAWSRTLGESIDFTIPTVPVKGQMMALADPPIPIRAVIAGCGGYIVPRADGTVAVGATEEHDAGFDTRVTPAGIVELSGIVERVAPSLAHARLAATWAGLRPGTTHGEAVIGRVPHLDNVWIATGHFRSGALLAPATADALAASITSGQLDPVLAPFDPANLR
jgi:glycine oxidase